MKERIKTCIANLKHLPGVYLMHDKDDKIIYICKDGKIRVCGFKDYEMDNVEVYDIFGEYLPTEE